MWWEPEPRSSQPGWDSRGPFERLPEPAWSSSGYGTPSAGTDCGTATPGSETPGRLSHCCRRGAARSPALWRNDATEPGYTNAGVANKGNNIRSETEASRIWPAVIWQTAWVEVRVRCGRFSPSLKMLGVPPIRDALRLMGGERWAKSGLDEPPDVYQNTHRCSERLQVETRTINLADCSNKSPFLKSQDAKRRKKPQTLHPAVSQPCTIVRLSCSPLQALQQLKSEGWSLDKDARGQKTHTQWTHTPPKRTKTPKRLSPRWWVSFFSGSLSVWTPPLSGLSERLFSSSSVWEAPAVLFTDDSKSNSQDRRCTLRIGDVPLCACTWRRATRSVFYSWWWRRGGGLLRYQETIKIKNISNNTENLPAICYPSWCVIGSLK